MDLDPRIAFHGAGALVEVAGWRTWVRMGSPASRQTAGLWGSQILGLKSSFWKDVRLPSSVPGASRLWEGVPSSITV